MTAELVSAISLYGPKPEPLRTVLTSIQGTAAAHLGAAFVPYALGQVHGTLVVLTGWRAAGGAVINQNYLEYRGERRPMDFGRGQEILRARLAEPIAIRIGGFGPGRPEPFSSQGRPLHERSFTAQSGALVLMGWPTAALESAGQVQPLDQLRREMTAAGVLHRYHRTPADVDDDFHLVVGHYAGAPPDCVSAAVSAVRDYLAGHPVDVQVGLDQVRIIASDTPTLASLRFSSGLPVPAARVAALYRAAVPPQMGVV
jgi:hypothetical protein